MMKRILSLSITLMLLVLCSATLHAQEPYAVLSDNNTVLTFYYDTQKSERDGMSVGPFEWDFSSWNEQRFKITTVVFDASFANYTSLTSTCLWFYECSKLTSIKGIENLKTDNVTNMRNMFTNCTSLTSLDVSGFKTDNVTNMCGMFWGCSRLTSLDVSGFKTDNVTDMSGMFNECSGLTSLDVSGFKTDNVMDMQLMFADCSSLTSLDVSGFKTDNVTNMQVMFSGCSSLTSLDVSGFKTDNVTYMGSMFNKCSRLKSLDVSSFKTDNVTTMGEMFSRCSSLKSLDVSGFKTDKVTDMGMMFCYCSGLTSLDVSGFKTNNVTWMYCMFGECSGLTSLDVSGFKTDNVTNMREMFSGCSGLTNLDVSGFKTDNVTDMCMMFRFCSSLTSLDLSGFKTNNVWDMSEMFWYCSSLTTIYAGNGWSTEKVTRGDEMFEGCTSLVGGAGTKYSDYHTDYTYARIDGGTANSGYLTEKNGSSELEPIDGETTISTDGLGAENLSDNTVDNVYYNVGAEGYDSTDGSIVIGETTNMEQINDLTPGSEDVKNNFTGLILKVAAGKGTIAVNVMTTGNAQLVVQVGNGTPMVASQTEKGDVVVSYDVTEDTYVYIYAVIGNSAIRATRIASDNVVRIYNIAVTPGATAIDTIRNSQSGSDSYYTLDGRKMEGLHTKKGLFIHNGKKIVIR